MGFERLGVVRQRFEDSNGLPLSGGKLYFYVSGSSIPLGTYQDSSGSTPNTNPVILDADGYAPNVYINLAAGDYKVVLKDSNDVTLWTVDPVTGSSPTATVSGWTVHNITDGQAATDLISQTLNLTLYSSALYDFEILRGTTVLTNGQIAVQVVNGTAQISEGVYMGAIDHGVTWSVTQGAGVAQLRAACSAGPGSGTIKLSRRLIPV